MKNRQILPALALLLAALAGVAAPQAANAQFGTVLTGAGPVNRSFGGVAVASPISPAGALFWNPATLSGFRRSELEAGVELLFPDTGLSSLVPAGSLGQGIPPITLSGSSSSDSGAFPLPTIGLAYVPKGSRFSYGLGVFALAGFGVDYAGSNTNPLLTAPPPRGLGIGPAYSEFQVFQIHPAISYQVTERFSIAAGPSLDLAMLKIDPATFATPDDANGDGSFSYPSGMHSQTTWGGGFDVGAYYRGDIWSFGTSIKSPQWFDKFRFNSFDELGFGRSVDYGLDLPTIVSWGTAYTGFERWVFAADLRYLDYHNANGLGESGFAPGGSLRGLGWKSIFAVSTGAQLQLTDTLVLRGGYTWTENPVPDSESSVNSVSSVIIEHVLSTGVSWNVTRDLAFNLAYIHAFENSIAGPIVTPAGAIPGTLVRNTASADSVAFGLSLKFGGCRLCRDKCSQCGPR